VLMPGRVFPQGALLRNHDARSCREAFDAASSFSVCADQKLL
jgi:hypothetical protein